MSAEKQERIDFFRGFGARVREVRLARDFTEREAADAIGITVRRLRRLESGQPFRGNHRALWIFSRLCGIDIAWLFEGTGVPCPPRSRPKLTLIVGGKSGQRQRTEAVHS
jgi:transcriptional regulator with XRE-family HTH domain